MPQDRIKIEIIAKYNFDSVQLDDSKMQSLIRQAIQKAIKEIEGTTISSWTSIQVIDSSHHKF